MTPATSHPVSLPQLSTGTVAAGVNVLISNTLDLCKSILPVSSPVTVNLPVVTSPAVVTLLSNCDVLPASTCDSPGSSFLHTASQAQPISLCPLAAPFVIDLAPSLYPAGKDRLGRDIITEDNTLMALEYNEVSPDGQDAVPPATPDIEDVRGLRKWVVKLPDGQEFTDKALPLSSSDVCMNQHFPPGYFLDLHERVRLVGARVPLRHSNL